MIRPTPLGWAAIASIGVWALLISTIILLVPSS